MSQTLTVGAVGASHWTYTAGVMARCLEQVIISRQTPLQIPKNVQRGAKRFLGLALQETSDQLPENPAASINAFKIAADAASETPSSAPKTREELGTRLGEYLGFIDRLNQPGALGTEELETAKALRRFFLCVYRDGEAERYERLVSQPWPRVAVRLF